MMLRHSLPGRRELLYLFAGQIHETEVVEYVAGIFPLGITSSRGVAMCCNIVVGLITCWVVVRVKLLVNAATLQRHS